MFYQQCIFSHYIIDDDVIIANVEMSCTSHSKFGNGILKEGEKEDVRIWLERNENRGRKVLPFMVCQAMPGCGQNTRATIH